MGTRGLSLGRLDGRSADSCRKKAATGLLAIALLLCFGSSAHSRDKYPPGPSYRSCADTLRIYDIQQTDTLLAPCHPRSFSPASGDTVLGIKGVIIGFDTKPAAYAFYIQNSQGGPYSGIQAFTGAFNWNASPYNLAIGDSVAVYGTTQEFPFTNGTTEIEGPDVVQLTNDIIIRKITSGNPLTYNIVDTHKLNWLPSSPGNEGEQWEGSLVRLRGPLRVGRASTQGGLPTLPFNSFLMVSVASPSESTLVDGNTLARYTPPAAGAIIDSVQGIVSQNTTSGMNSYRVQMRDGDDVFGPYPTSPMRFDFTPNTLNLASRGRWVTGFLEPAPPFTAGDIDIPSVRLNGAVPVDPAGPTALADHHGNGVPDLMVKFDRAAVELTVSEGDSVAVTVNGKLDGHSFLSTDYIRVRRGRISAPLAGSRLAAGSMAPVRWETPGGVTAEPVALLFSPDGGGTWSPIARGQPNTGSYDWTVPNVPTDQAKVAVVVESAEETGDLVDGVLGISEAFSIGAVVGVGDRGPGDHALAIRGATPSPAVGGRLRVAFTLPDGSPARLVLVDVAGRVVTSEQVGTLGPGRHSVELSDGGALPPGIYFLRLTQGGREARARAAVLR